ncbi:MAG: CAP domain-containing protein [Chitinophagaceae bacterium]|nr:MAG: CAP domain-containing protein [Chitinophagaceae bacterium]
MIRTFFFLSFFLLLFSSFSLRAQSIREDVLKYTNELRRSKGLPALEMKDGLNKLAQEHSSNMAKGKTSFGHDGFMQRQQAAHKFFSTINAFAENVAYGAKTGKEVVKGWQRSPGHRRNMLGKYRYIGIGVARNKKGTLYYTQVFVN